MNSLGTDCRGVRLWKVAAPVTLPTNSGWVLTGKLTGSIRGINSDLGPLSWPSLPFDAPLFSPFERRSPNPFPINNYALRRLNPGRLTSSPYSQFGAATIPHALLSGRTHVRRAFCVHARNRRP